MKPMTTEQRHAHIDRQVMRGYKSSYVIWCLDMALDLDNPINQAHYLVAFQGAGKASEFCRHGIKTCGF
jgi:hypothetical protein